MDSIKKYFANFLVLALVISFVFPAFCSISEASNESEYISIEIYQDEDKIVTAEVPKKLSNDQKFLDSIKKEYLNSLNNYENLPLPLLHSSVRPFYITPTQPTKPTRKLLSVKKWTLSELKSRLSATKKGNAIIKKALGSDIANIAVAIMEAFGAKGVASLTQALLKGFHNAVGGRSEKWLSESLAMMLKGKIRYVEQRIYENLAGDYPKVFVETVRVK